MKTFFPGLIALFSLMPHFVISKSDLDLIRDRVIVELMNPAVDDQKIAALITTINDDGTWPDIDYEDVSRTGFEHRNHYSNMIALARAYKSRDSKFHKKKNVKQTVELALTNWVENDYICDNWWHNQIGTTNGLVTLMLIIGDELPDDLVQKAQPIIKRAHVDAPGARPGGDRIKIAGIQAKNMLFLRDAETFNEVISVIESEIKFVDWVGATYGYGYRKIATGFSNRMAGGRGIQYDNSFHHRVDGVNNILSYGLGYADAFVEWAIYTLGTKYVFSDDKLEQLIDYYLDGICKTAIFGKYPDPGAKNRSISRKGTLRPYSAKTAEKLLLTSNYRRRELQEIVDIRNKSLKPSTSHATFYWHSEHFAFQRPDFFTSVRMYSSRVHNMEEPYNSEGLLNHHRGDGTNHISITGDEYFDIAPVYDYQKIPGATIMQKPSMPSEKEIQKLGQMDFAGATTDGRYAVVGFDFKSPHDPLVARKAWFFFDEEYVCLGAGISCRKELPVVTTLNQCLLRGDVAVSSEKQVSIIPNGEHEYKKVDWVFQDGIGYVFPSPTDINVKNDNTSGSWWRINKQADSPRDEINLDVFMLWLDHGYRPSDKSYEYIVVPATDTGKLKQDISKKNIAILLNTPEIQAVKHQALDVVQIVFYKSGEVEISDGIVVKSDVPGIVMIKMKEGQVDELSVSDPNRELGKMHVSISAKVDKTGEKFKCDWHADKKFSEITIDLPNGVYAGQSVTVNCR